MPYTKVQYIGGAFDTSFISKAKIQYRNPDARIEKDAKYSGAMDVNMDVTIRIDLIRTFLKKVLQSRQLNRARDVLKIFMLPEFYWRGIEGGYRNEGLEDISITILRKLQAEISSSEDYEDWIFIWGTLVSYKQMVGHYVVKNCALISEGGREGVQFQILKDNIADYDFAPPKSRDYKVRVDEGMHLVKLSNTLSRIKKPGVRDSPFFNAKGVCFGIEICVDHASARIRQAIYSLPDGHPLPQIICIPAAGMSISEEHVYDRFRNVHLFLVDGNGIGRKVDLQNFTQVDGRGKSLTKLPLTETRVSQVDFIQSLISIEHQEEMNKAAKIIVHILKEHPLYGDGDLSEVQWNEASGRRELDPRYLKKAAYVYLLRELKFSLFEEQLGAVLVRILLLLLGTEGPPTDLAAKDFTDLCRLINSVTVFRNKYYTRESEARVEKYLTNTSLALTLAHYESREASLDVSIRAVYGEIFLRILNKLFRSPERSILGRYYEIADYNQFKKGIYRYVQRTFAYELPPTILLPLYWPQIIGQNLADFQRNLLADMRRGSSTSSGWGSSSSSVSSGSESSTFSLSKSGRKQGVKRGARRDDDSDEEATSGAGFSKRRVVGFTEDLDGRGDNEIEKALKAQKTAYQSRRREFLLKYKLTNQFFFSISDSFIIPSLEVKG